VRRFLLLAAALMQFDPVAGAEPALTVERLLSDGWQVAGYTGTFDNRSSLILFRHADRKYLVQCSVLHDVTRTPRVNMNCYELR
jgi:hypothetical protein